MKEIRITLRLTEWEIIPIGKFTNREISLRFLFLDFYVLRKNKI